MRKHGAQTALVSGGFTVFANHIAQRLGFHLVVANKLVEENGKFTGLVEEPILGKEAKLSTLVSLREEYKLGKHETLAVGDGANDLPMLLEAGLGVAFHAKPIVAAAAQARVECGDLTVLLYAQGYRREEIVREERGEVNASDWMKKYAWMAKTHDRKA
jgi:phosphoserine phosphatase